MTAGLTFYGTHEIRRNYVLGLRASYIASLGFHNHFLPSFDSGPESGTPRRTIFDLRDE